MVKAYSVESCFEGSINDWSEYCDREPARLDDASTQTFWAINVVENSLAINTFGPGRENSAYSKTSFGYRRIVHFGCHAMNSCPSEEFHDLRYIRTCYFEMKNA
jgi:hypothetical protein